MDLIQKETKERINLILSKNQNRLLIQENENKKEVNKIKNIALKELAEIKSYIDFETFYLAVERIDQGWNHIDKVNLLEVQQDSMSRS